MPEESARELKTKAQSTAENLEKTQAPHENLVSRLITRITRDTIWVIGIINLLTK